MEALLLLATLGPASCLLGCSVGANLRLRAFVLRRTGIWLLATLVVWSVWPSYSENMVLWKHMLVHGGVFIAGIRGGIAYAKAIETRKTLPSPAKVE